jgi:Zn2+/Cd2+-exporting ATPase
MNNQKLFNAKYTISGMDCAGCVNTVETFCNKIKGIKEAKINFSSSTLSVIFSTHENAKEKLEKGIKSLGYKLKEHEADKPVTQQSHDVSLTNRLSKNFKEKSKAQNRQSELNGNDHHKHDSCCNDDHHHDHGKNENHEPHNHDHSNEKMNWLPIIALSCAFLVSMGIEYYSKNIGFIAFSLVTLIGLLPVLKKSLVLMKVGYVFSVETLMSISALGAIFIGASEEAAAVIILFMIGEALEGYSTKKAQAGIKSLASLLPDSALFVAKDGSTQIIKPSEIKVGDFIEVKPGERSAIDGIIRKGTSYIDESLLTGESLPLYKSIGDKVVAGSISTDGNIIIEASLPGNNNTITRMIKMVEDAQSSKSRVMRSIEKFSRVYTPIILILGTLVAVIPPLFLSMPWTEWIYRGLTILLIGCPCALVISTPSAIAASITAATKMGILIKNATAMESIGKVTRIAFDKTGTITSGKLTVKDIVPFEKNENEILRIAAMVESKSNHPLAKAIYETAKQKKLVIDDVMEAKSLAGKGASAIINNKIALVCSPIYATELNYLNEQQIQQIKNVQRQGKTIAVVILDNVAQGFIALADQLKSDAKASLEKLKKLGIESIILTGDNSLSAQAIAGHLNAEIRAELLPEQKLNYIQSISKREKVAMVGDGINDAPAIAAAEIGIAMGGGTDVAVDTSQIVISRNNVSAIVDTVILSRKTMNNIKQNITLAIGLKAIFLILTIFGETQLWMAILADTGATVIVTLNALRLLKVKPQNLLLKKKSANYPSTELLKQN